MANLKQAEKARKQFADELALRGAHAIGVERASAGSGWTVVAYVEPGADFTAPERLSAEVAGAQVEVPLVVQREESFKLE